MQDKLQKLAEMLRPRADEVNLVDGVLVVYVTGQRNARDLMALTTQNGLHAHMLQQVIANRNNVYAFEVSPHRVYVPKELRALTGFTEAGRTNHIPWTAAKSGDWWYVVAQPDWSPQLLLFHSPSLYSWHFVGDKPRAARQALRYTLLDPTDPAMKEKIRAFMLGKF